MPVVLVGALATYRWIRHPLYTTAGILFIALGLIAANWLMLLFAVLALVSIRFAVVPLEERHLMARITIAATLAVFFWLSVPRDRDVG